jgi:hypothetical protein
MPASRIKHSGHAHIIAIDRFTSHFFISINACNARSHNLVHNIEVLSGFFEEQQEFFIRRRGEEILFLWRILVVFHKLPGKTFFRVLTP